MLLVFGVCRFALCVVVCCCLLLFVVVCCCLLLFVRRCLLCAVVASCLMLFIACCCFAVAAYGVSVLAAVCCLVLFANNCSLWLCGVCLFCLVSLDVARGCCLLCGVYGLSLQCVLLLLVLLYVVGNRMLYFCRCCVMAVGATGC